MGDKEIMFDKRGVMCYNSALSLFSFMLKLFYTLLFSFAVNSVYAFDISIHDRNSFQIIFGNTHYELNANLSDYDFLVYIRALEYTLTNLDELGMIEWSSPGSTVSGKITIITKNQEGSMICKSFIHSLIISNKIYEGEGVGCNLNGQWTVKPLK